jgi:squalene-associated FAD-dependent desaturase
MTPDRIVVIGGGLAGITAAIGLAEGGLPVTVLEARPWLGGATWSFGRRGLTIDNGQHAFLRCFTAYRDLLAKLGVGGSVRIQDRLDLTVLTSDGPHPIRRNGWPAPLHLARMLAGYRTLTLAQRISVMQAVMALWLSDLSGRDDASIGDWLSRHGQDERTRSELWDAFLVPVLNTASDQADLGTAAGMINAALLSRRDQADLGITSVPLRDLHGGPAGRLLAELGAEVRVRAQVTSIRCREGGGYTLGIGTADPSGQLSFEQCDPDLIAAAGVVLAVPPWTAATLVPPELTGAAASWAGLEPSPVVSVHVIYNRRVTRLPFALATQPPLRWITDKTRSAGLHTGQYLAASLPAAAAYVDSPAAAIREQVLPEIERLFPAAAAAGVEDFFVTRERTATFRPAPGSLLRRPDQVTDLPGFTLAGAWTSTGWPDTMEGAVRSGRLAAQSVLRALAADKTEAAPARTRPAALPESPAGQLAVPGAGAGPAQVPEGTPITTGTGSAKTRPAGTQPGQGPARQDNGAPAARSAGQARAASDPGKPPRRRAPKAAPGRRAPRPDGPAAAAVPDPAGGQTEAEAVRP